MPVTAVTAASKAQVCYKSMAGRWFSALM